MSSSKSNTIFSEPYPFSCDLSSTALLMIDMQRDFLEPGGFGEALGNDVSLLRRTIKPCQDLLTAARQHNLFIIHTREGHRSDLSDAPLTKLQRGHLPTGIGDKGPLGRILVRGSAGHNIIPELAPQSNEVVVDKPGKGAFYSTDLDLVLRNRGIKSLFVCGITTEVCVHSTVREATDRGYECLILEDCVGSYFPSYHLVALDIIKSQGGIFGWVSQSRHVLDWIGGASGKEGT